MIKKEWKQFTPFTATSSMPRNASGAIAHLRCQLTPADPNPLRKAPICPCNGKASSSEHLLLHCALHTKGREAFLTGYHGQPTWQSITNDDINPKALLRFMQQTGLTRRVRIITCKEDARNADYEGGADI